MDEKNRLQSTKAGAKGQKAVRLLESKGGKWGSSGATNGNNVMRIYKLRRQQSSRWGRSKRLFIYPEGLFAKEIGVSWPCPKTSSYESPLCIGGSPLNSGADPFVLIDLASLFVCLEWVLLIVRSELGQDINQGKCSKDVIRSTEGSGLLKCRYMRWQSQ